MGDDSILNASIRISCVELKKAKRVMNNAVKKIFLCGSVKETSINAKIINNCVKINQLRLWPSFLNSGSL